MSVEENSNVPKSRIGILPLLSVVLLLFAFGFMKFQEYRIDKKATQEVSETEFLEKLKRGELREIRIGANELLGSYRPGQLLKKNRVRASTESPLSADRIREIEQAATDSKTEIKRVP